MFHSPCNGLFHVIYLVTCSRPWSAFTTPYSVLTTDYKLHCTTQHLTLFDMSSTVEKLRSILQKKAVRTGTVGVQYSNAQCNAPSTVR